MYVKENFPHRFRELRERIGVSQDEFAKALKVSRATISYYENGTRTPDIDFLDKVFDLTGCSVEYLLGYERAMGKHSSVLATHTGLQDEAIEELSYYDSSVLNFILTNQNMWEMAYTLGMLCNPEIREEFLEYDDTAEFLVYKVQMSAKQLAEDVFTNEELYDLKEAIRDGGHDDSPTHEMRDTMQHYQAIMQYLRDARSHTKLYPMRFGLTEEEKQLAQSNPYMAFKLRLEAVENALSDE